MPRNWRTTLFLATQGGSQPEVAIYPTVPGNFESLSLDNTPSDLVWYNSPESSRQNMSDTRLTLMKIRLMQMREKERTREVMEEESLANALAAINIDSQSNYAQESSASVDSLTSTFVPQHDTQAFTGNVLKPEAHSSLGDFIPNTSSERRCSQGMLIFAPRTSDSPFPSQHEETGIIIPTSIVRRQPRVRGVHRTRWSS
ncbi:hypothetical protein ARMSODRAFT_179779 [Armillaria solidipes]|uniref:Uncharacterized protein n=1 Tax=Armillaria solidipes TaxID=1076256 RepID=A0A2H3C1M2_9AGAR|nr:hypothetical protein ARMSODRAFT_179779 [Armillaria solidipes]